MTGEEAVRRVQEFERDFGFPKSGTESVLALLTTMRFAIGLAQISLSECVPIVGDPLMTAQKRRQAAIDALENAIEMLNIFEGKPKP